jgi:hypothetical protein
MPNNNLEARFQAECYAWFCHTYPTERPYLWMNYNNPPGAFQGAQLKSMGMLAGIADMTYLASGNYPYFLELKLPNGKQSQQQIEFAKNIELRGGIYAVVRSIEDFKFWVHVGMTHAGHSVNAFELLAYCEFMGLKQVPMRNIKFWLWARRNFADTKLNQDTIDYFTNLKLTIQ